MIRSLHHLIFLSGPLKILTLKRVNESRNRAIIPRNWIYYIETLVFLYVRERISL